MKKRLQLLALGIGCAMMGCDSEAAVEPFPGTETEEMPWELLVETIWCNRGGGYGFGFAPVGVPFYLPWGSTWDYVVDDNDWGADFDNIHDAITAAQDGDRIYVCPGTYEGQLDIWDDVELLSLGGACDTIIESPAGTNGTVVDIHSSAIIEGFTITGSQFTGQCFYGGGVHIGGQYGETRIYPELRHNRIVDNVACKVAGIYVGGMESNNGEYTNVTVTIENNIIADNYSEVMNAGAIAINSTRSTSTAIDNNVIAYNESFQGSGGIEIHNGDAHGTRVRGNILYNNVGSAGIAVISLDDPFETLIAGFNDLYGNSLEWYDGFFDIYDDPDFDNEQTYALDNNSPCIDAGFWSSSYNDPDGTRNDIGAYGGPSGDWECTP